MTTVKGPLTFPRPSTTNSFQDCHPRAWMVLHRLRTYMLVVSVNQTVSVGMLNNRECLRETSEAQTTQRIFEG